MLLELMSKKGQALAELLAPLKAKYFISGEINTKVASMDVVKKKLDGLTAKYADATVAHLDGVSVDYPDWHCRPSNTGRCCVESEATPPEDGAEAGRRRFIGLLIVDCGCRLTTGNHQPASAI
jgi:phosphomannomutase